MRVQLVVVGLLALAVATATPSRKGQTSLNPSTKLARASNYFALNLLKALPHQQNSIFSPLSIFTALSMAYSGAGGTTFQELRTALGFERVDMPHNNVQLAFKQLLGSLNGSLDGNVTLKVANKALTDIKLDALDAYINAIREYFGVELEEVDFARDGEDIKNNVNRWVSVNTNGKIPTLLDSPPDADTAMLLMNAVYFNASWKTPFSLVNTKSDTFYLYGTTPSSVRMMFAIRDAKYTHSEELSCKALELPYTGDRMSMLLILPDAKDGLEELEQQLTSEKLQKLVEDLEMTQSVIIKIPSFKMEQKYDLETILPELGIVKAFRKSEANFSNITRRPIYISKVLHKAFIRVDESHTEASAATLLNVVFASGLIYDPTRTTFVVEHPFLFAIWDRLTGQMLFLGHAFDLP